MSQAPEPKQKSRGVWLRVVLFTSLAVNLLIVGMVAGAIIRGGPPGRGFEARQLPTADFGFAPYVRALSPSDRRDLGREMRELTGDRRANREEFIAFARAFLDALRANPYDPAALQQSVARQQARLFGHQQVGQRILLGRLAHMSDGERAAYAGRLERSLRRALGEE
jgi:uncharacterized membrane protein